MSRTFLNIGAGTCQLPDPLFQLAHSQEGAGFRGLAVDANASALRLCRRHLSGSKAVVQTANVAVEPTTAGAMLRTPLQRLFARQGFANSTAPPWPLDVLVVDIDGCDCLVAEELMQLVQPKVLVVEIAYFVPPPFRFSSQHDAASNTKWMEEYDVNRLNPASGCSLSYALHRFARYGLHLLRLTLLDAVFVHESVIPVFERSFGVQFPQDEFLCYRRSRLWMQMPADYVREWFFAQHPGDSFGRIWANLTALQAEVGQQGLPFTLDY